MFYDTVDRRWESMRRDFKAQEDAQTTFRKIQKALRGEDGAPTNTLWEYLTSTLPQIVFQNPGLVVESSSPGEVEADDIGLQAGMSVLMERDRYVRTWERIGADMLAWRGISMVTMEPNFALRSLDGLDVFGAGKDTVRPRMVWLHPEDFFLDSDAASTESARRMGHKWTASIADLKAYAELDSSWDIDLVESIGRTQQRDAGLSDESLVDVIEMFVPRYRDPEAIDAHSVDGEDPEGCLYTGTIYTMIEGGDGGRDVRKPRLYRGPECGPYGVYEGVPLPGEQRRQAPMMAVMKQVDADARVGNALISSCEAYKRLVLTASEEMADAIRDGVSDGVASLQVAVERFKEAWAEISIGGPPRELVEAYTLTREALDRSLGISDSKRGMARGNTTATAEAIADKSADMRLALLVSTFQEVAASQLWVVAWQMEHTPEVEVPLPTSALEEMLESLDVPTDVGGDRAVYRGGGALDGEEPGRSFAGRVIRIQPMSMERTSEATQQRRVMEVMGIVERLVQLRGIAPDLPIDKIADEFGARMNMPGLGRYLGGVEAQAGGPGGQMPVAPGGGMVGPAVGAEAAGGALR